MNHTIAGSEFIIKDTHRGLYYTDGQLTKVLGAGRYRIPPSPWFRKGPSYECVLVDVRQRELTIKGQEILTADKVAIRVSILVQFRVTDPQAAIHGVENYEDRLYSDVQLAARRTLATMNLEEILTNRNQLSETILSDVAESASSYGVLISRADVKDLIFPGNVQEIMNRVLVAERNSQAQLVDARTRSAVEKLEAETRTEIQKQQAATDAEVERLKREAETLAIREAARAEAEAYHEKAQAAELLQQTPALLRLAELETLKRLASNANARLYFQSSLQPLSD